MKRWWLVIALTLSVGVNLGIFASRLLPARDTPADIPASGPPGQAEARPEVDRPPRAGVDRPPDSWPADRPVPRLVLRMAEELRLEGEARERFVELQMRFLRQSFEARAHIRRSQTHLRHELLAQEPNRARVGESLDQMARAREQLERVFVESVLETRQILDPEQSGRYLRMIARLRQTSEQMRQQRMQRPPGPRGGQRPW